MKSDSIFVFLLLSLLFVCECAKAQRRQMDIGLEAGPSLSTFHLSQRLKNHSNPLLCYTTGIFLNYNINKHLALKTGIYYDLKGRSYRVEAVNGYPGPTRAVDWKDNFQYLTIPVLPKFSIGNKTKFSVLAGPYFSYLLYSDFEVDRRYYFYVNSTTTQNYNRIELGLIAGLGLSHTLNERFIISLEVRDQAGLTNIYKYKPNRFFYNKIIANTLNAVLGVSWRFGKKQSTTQPS